MRAWDLLAEDEPNPGLVGGAADLAVSRWAHGSLPGASDQLEGEQLCTCDHLDGCHRLGANECDVPGCSCEAFELVVQLEIVGGDW